MGLVADLVSAGTTGSGGSEAAVSMEPNVRRRQPDGTSARRGTSAGTEEEETEQPKLSISVFHQVPAAAQEAKLLFLVHLNEN